MSIKFHFINCLPVLLLKVPERYIIRIEKLVQQKATISVHHFCSSLVMASLYDNIVSIPPLWLLAVCLTVASFAYVLYLRYLHPLASIPGPFWASLSRLWMAKHAWDGDMNVTMIELHKKYGPLVRTAPDEVSISDTDAIKKIYGAGTKFRKSDWYSVWQGHRTFDLFAERNERLHGEQRRLVSRAYSMDALKDLEPYVEKALAVFFEKMKEREGEVIDMGNWVQLFAFGETRLSAIMQAFSADLHRRGWRGDVQQAIRLHGRWSRRRNVRTNRGRSKIGRLDRAASSLVRDSPRIPCSSPRLTWFLQVLDT